MQECEMIRVDVIRKSDAVRRIAKGLPAYGIVWCWDEIVVVDLLNDAMRKAFLERFKGMRGSVNGIYYASGFSEFDESKGIDLEPGKCILHKARMKQVKTTKTFYRYYQHSEEEYWKKVNKEFAEENLED